MPGHLNRDRIRDYLAAAGAVVDDGGQATAILRAAINYSGSDVGFSQLLSAMEQRGEIEREIRGKRTYRIAPARPAGMPPAGLSASTRAHAASSSTISPERAAGSLPAIDYDALAAALLGRVVSVLNARKPADQNVEGLLADLKRVTAERDGLRARLEEFEDRLSRADRNTAILLQMMRPKSAPDSGESVALASDDLVEALLGTLGRPQTVPQSGQAAQAS